MSLTIPRSTSMPLSADQILLGTFTYDPASPSHIQTFPVEPEIVEMGIEMGIVIFRVQSNWGAEFTCLYRVSLEQKLRSSRDADRLLQVRVHGE